MDTRKPSFNEKTGGPTRTRTEDLRIKRPYANVITWPALRLAMRQAIRREPTVAQTLPGIRSVTS